MGKFCFVFFFPQENFEVQFLPARSTPQWEGGVVSALYVLQIRVQCRVHFFSLGMLREFLWCICSWHYICMQPRLSWTPEFLTLNPLLLLSGFQLGSIQKMRSVKTKVFPRAHRRSVVILSAPSPLPFLRPVVRAPCFVSLLLCTWECSGVRWTRWMLRSNLKWVH